MPKISQLPTLETITTGSIIPVVENSITQKLSVGKLFEFLSGALDETFATETELMLTASAGSVNTSSLVTTSSFNSYTSSNDGKWNTLGGQTGSFVTEAETSSFVTNVSMFLSKSAFDTYTGSAATAVSSAINSATSSLSSSNAALDNIQLFTSTFNTFTSSVNSFSASVNGKTGSYATTGSNTFIGTQGITGSLIVTAQSLSIGDSFEGGKVAYILQSVDAGYDPTITKGIIAALLDEPGTYVWPQAITVANNKTTNGYTDWYLPSDSELNKLYINKVAIGNFVNDTYWSSTEYDATNALVQNFGSGVQEQQAKGFPSYVRAVRAFSIPIALNVTGSVFISSSLFVSEIQSFNTPLTITAGDNSWVFDGNAGGLIFPDSGSASTKSFHSGSSLGSSGNGIIQGVSIHGANLVGTFCISNTKA
jgi:hypothetical protein